MLWFDIMVPVLALAVAAGGIFYIRREAAKLDRIERQPGK